jgi:hypothetical protein
VVDAHAQIWWSWLFLMTTWMTQPVFEVWLEWPNTLNVGFFFLVQCCIAMLIIFFWS